MTSVECPLQYDAIQSHGQGKFIKCNEPKTCIFRDTYILDPSEILQITWWVMYWTLGKILFLNYILLLLQTNIWRYIKDWLATGYENNSFIIWYLYKLIYFVFFLAFLCQGIVILLYNAIMFTIVHFGLMCQRHSIISFKRLGTFTHPLKLDIIYVNKWFSILPWWKYDYVSSPVPGNLVYF